MKLLSALFQLTLLWRLADAHRILGVFPRNSPSNFMVFEQLMKGLADRGHEVDVISSFPQTRLYPNYYDIIKLPNATPTLVNNVTYKNVIDKTMSVLNLINTKHGNDVCHALGNPHIQNLIQNPQDKRYSVVITEVFIANCFIILGEALKVPVVGVSTYGRLPWVYDIVGNPEGFDFVPEQLGFNHITYWQRLSTIVSHAYEKWSFYKNTKVQTDILKQHIGKNVLGIRELESTVALMLTNAHPLTHGVRALSPALIEVAGMHLVSKNIQPLFEDIQKWLDECKDGAVYFNLGTEFVFESLPVEIIQVFYKSFKKLAPMRVLMRVSNYGDLPPGLPENVLTVPWVQQLKVLEHPNVRAFITHGGLQGVQEAFYTAVPVIGIPLWDDQFENVDLCVKKNIGLRIDVDRITEKTLDWTLSRVLKNSTFKESASAFSLAFFDRPVSAIDTACYWIEYVIRRSNNSLKLPLTQCAWLQCFNLDVFATFFSIFLLTMFAMLLLFRKIVHTVLPKLFKRKQSHQKLL